jgi:hypothetical protein
MVTSLRNGQTCFGSHNWETELPPVQSVASGRLAQPQIKWAPLVFYAGK